MSPLAPISSVKYKSKLLPPSAPDFSQISQLQNSPIPAQRLLFFVFFWFFLFFFGGKLAIINGKQRIFFVFGFLLKNLAKKCKKNLIEREYSVAIFLKILLDISPYFD
jgi:hypothetical protein